MKPFGKSLNVIILSALRFYEIKKCNLKEDCNVLVYSLIQSL